MRWVRVWTHRGSEVGTGMDIHRVRWVHVWTLRGWAGYMHGHSEGEGYMHGHTEGEVGTCMDT